MNMYGQTFTPCEWNWPETGAEKQKGYRPVAILTNPLT